MTAETGCTAPTQRRRAGMREVDGAALGLGARLIEFGTPARVMAASARSLRALTAAPKARRSSGARVASVFRAAVISPAFRPTSAISSRSRAAWSRLARAAMRGNRESSSG